MLTVLTSCKPAEVSRSWCLYTWFTGLNMLQMDADVWSKMMTVSTPCIQRAGRRQASGAIKTLRKHWMPLMQAQEGCSGCKTWLYVT